MLEIRMLNKSCYFCTHNLNKVVLRAKERSHKKKTSKERGDSNLPEPEKLRFWLQFH